MSEFSLIASIREMFPSPEGVKGIGDDCAVIPQQSGRDTLVSTDMLMEGSHFLLDDVSAFQLGWKSAAVNISDIAGMGGHPTATFLSFALPKSLPDGWIDEFLRGYKTVSDKFGVALLGGDTVSSPGGLCINVTVLGECPSGKAVLRSGARPGDRICVSGPLGESATGLKIILEAVPRGADEDALVRRHYLPMPRVPEGLVLSGCPGIGAMMDISDGIASDLRHIMEESGVGARIDVGSLPVSERMRSVCSAHGWDPTDLAAGGGEDYELLFTLRPGCVPPSIPYFEIGEITPDKSLVWIGGEKDYKGFEHF